MAKSGVGSRAGDKRLSLVTVVGLLIALVAIAWGVQNLTVGSQAATLGGHGEDDYYVATTGNDTTGNGSKEKPWRTLRHTFSKLPAQNSEVYVLIVGPTYTVAVADQGLEITTQAKSVSLTGMDTQLLTQVTGNKGIRLVPADGGKLAVSYLDFSDSYLLVSAAGANEYVKISYNKFRGRAINSQLSVNAGIGALIEVGHNEFHLTRTLARTEGRGVNVLSTGSGEVRVFRNLFGFAFIRPTDTYYLRGIAVVGNADRYPEASVEVIENKFAGPSTPSGGGSIKEDSRQVGVYVWDGKSKLNKEDVERLNTFLPGFQGIRTSGI